MSRPGQSRPVLPLAGWAATWGAPLLADLFADDIFASGVAATALPRNTPLYVNDDQGRTFINPLYAFDGCLG